VTPGAASLSLAVARSGRGTASWVATSCTGDPAAGTPPGVLHASALRDGAFRSPVVLTGQAGQPLMTSRSTALSPVGAGSLVTLTSGSDPLQVTLDRDGRQTSVAPTSVASMPLAADAAGNLLVSAPFIGVTVRRPDSTEDPFVRPVRSRPRRAARRPAPRQLAVDAPEPLVLAPLGARAAGPS
jgi:hypothetical protein